MKNVLVIQSSLNNQSGNSTKLANQYIDTLQSSAPISLTIRNINELALPHLSQREMQAWMTPAEQRSEEQAELASISDSIVKDVMAADEVVLAVPMYNFGIPSVLKAWFDRLARAGVTFQYTENGPQGLLHDTQVTVLAARGGKYQGSELDTQTDYIKHFFAFLGLTDVRFVYAEGLAMGDEVATQSWQQANQKIIELTA